jgi:hypothetical protein
MGAWDGNKTFAAYIGIACGAERFYIFKHHAVTLEPVE